jgi:hypothetical protein
MVCASQQRVAAAAVVVVIIIIQLVTRVNDNSSGLLHANTKHNKTRK